MDTHTAPTAPGRLGDPSMCIATDPRIDARLTAAMAPFGMDRNAEVPPGDGPPSLADCLEGSIAGEDGLRQLFSVIYADLPEPQGVERSVETIDGVDGNQIRLHIHRPADAS